MTCVPIKEKVEPLTSIIYNLIVPSSTMESESPVFPKKLGPSRIKYIINIKIQKNKKKKLVILNNLLKKTFHLKNYPKVFMSVCKCMRK
jgi:hypothetical protein